MMWERTQEAVLLLLLLLLLPENRFPMLATRATAEALVLEQESGGASA
jgi:hypothetical protein